MSSRLSSGLLLAAFVSGLVACGAAFFALHGLDGTVWQRLFTSASVLTFSKLSDAQPGIYLDIAHGAALVFGLTAVGGLLLDVSPSVREEIRRVRFRLMRIDRKRRPVVVIGLGWIGGALASEIRSEGRPVYALALDAAGPQAKAARNAGVLVIEGNAATAAALARLPLATTEEVFIATGDDVRNIEIAGAILEVKPTRQRTTYVHVSDPSIGGVVSQRGLLPATEGIGSYRLFSVLDHAARDLAANLHRRLAPSDAQTIHVALFGFGALGQTIALRLARTMHFTNARRLRLTVFYTSAEVSRVARFRALHPGFGPSSAFSLASFTAKHGPEADRWGQGPDAIRPDAPAWRVRDRPAWPAAVEVAVLSEFILSDTPVSPETTALLRERFRTGSVPEVRPAIVVATDDEHLNARYAVGLQDALATERSWPPNPTRNPDTDSLDLSPPLLPDDGLATEIPIYPYLFDETGLTTLVRRMQVTRSAATFAEKNDWISYHRTRLLPIRSFGLRRSTASHRVVTNKTQREDAAQLNETYRILKGEDSSKPMESIFEISNMDAAALAVYTLKRYFLSSDRWLSQSEARERGVHPRPLLALPELPLFTRLVGATPQRSGVHDRRYPAFKPEVRPYHVLVPFKKMSVEHARGYCRQLPAEWTDLLDPQVCPLPHAFESDRERQARHDVLDTLASWVEQCIQHDALRHAMLVDEDREATLQVIRQFEAEIDSQSETHQPPLSDRLAAMEHNRWMAERLVFGWRAGSRNDAGRRRETMLPWSLLDEEQQHYDRAHLPRIIIGHQAPIGQLEAGTLYYRRKQVGWQAL